MVPQLPTELKISIIERVSKRSLPAVLRANSSFRDITEPILYSVVNLAPFIRQTKLLDVVAECFRTMMARPSVAAAVRCLRVNLSMGDDTQHDHDVIGEVFEALGGALVKLVNLEKLELSGWDHRGTLPTWLPRGLPLQSLQHYYGPPEVADNIQSKVLVTLRIVAYRPRATETSRALLAAARSSSGTLRTLDIEREEHDYDEEWSEIVAQIPSLFPNVKFLGLGNWPALDEELIDELIPSLASLESLRLFQIGEGYVIGYKREKQYVKRLHEGCPQLRAISLHNGVWSFDENLRKWELVKPQPDGFVYESTVY